MSADDLGEVETEGSVAFHFDGLLEAGEEIRTLVTKLRAGRENGSDEANGNGWQCSHSRI